MTRWAYTVATDREKKNGKSPCAHGLDSLFKKGRWVCWLEDVVHKSSDVSILAAMV